MENTWTNYNGTTQTAGEFIQYLSTKWDRLTKDSHPRANKFISQVILGDIGRIQTLPLNKKEKIQLEKLIKKIS